MYLDCTYNYVTLEIFYSLLAGPTAPIQFSIWECGIVNMALLTDKLLLAIKHATCDVITEYRLLTAPRCEPPPHYNKGIVSPLHSTLPRPLTHSFSPEVGPCFF